MREDIRRLWARLNSTYWFYPALFSLASVALALSLIYLDRHGFADSLNDEPWLVPARPQSASTMLNIIAGSMIGVASTVFSITIAAVAYASGNYGPRLLTNFMEDRGNQLSLATFIGTFVYAITVLRTVRAENEEASSAADAASTILPGFVPQLSLLVAYALMALSIAVLVYFLNHIPSSIRINTVLKGIGERLLDAVRKGFPERNGGEIAPQAPEGGIEVKAERTGYVQFIDYAGLGKFARDHEATVVLEVRTGDFVHEGVTFARVIGADEAKCDLAGCFSLGSSRTPKQDPQFLIDELVEIGLRALSPGINDPFTAITALHWLGAATAELGGRDLLRRDLDRDSEGDRTTNVFPLADDFDHYLRRGFGAIRGAVAASHTASLVMFDTLRNTARSIDDESRVRLLRQHGDLLMQQVRTEIDGPDLHDIEAHYILFTQALPG